MCFRPSAVEGGSSQVQQGACPHCGQPVAESIITSGGTCSYCNKTIPAASKGDMGTSGTTGNVKIF